MRCAYVTPFAEPEKGACVLRANSFKRFFAKDHVVEQWAPARMGVATADGVRRYANKRALMRGIREGKYDVVVGTSPPMTHSFFALLAAKSAGVPFVLDLRDPWTHATKALNVYARHSLKPIAYRFIEKTSIRLADRIFAVTPVIVSQTIEDGGAREKVFEIPNGTDPTIFFFEPNSRERFRDAWNVKAIEPVFVYAGAFRDWNVEKVIETLGGLSQHGPFTLLLFCPLGKKHGVQAADLKELVARHGLVDRSIIVDSSELAFSTNRSYLSAADWGLNPVPAGLEYCIPAKTYDYAACGLQSVAVAPPAGALHQLYERHPLGPFAGDWEAFREQLAKIIRDPSTGRVERAITARLAADHFDRQLAWKKAEPILLALAKK